jgi:hypothetical protein
LAPYLHANPPRRHFASSAMPARAAAAKSRAALLLALASISSVVVAYRSDAVLAAGAAAWEAPPSPSASTTEPLTKVQFKNGVWRDTTLYRLCAVSVRIMMGLSWLERARAYAFGVYLAPSGVGAMDQAQTEEQALELVNPLPLRGAKSRADSLSDFIPSPSFAGSRPGFYFTKGPKGMGYYLDKEQGSQKQRAKAQEPGVMVRLVMLRDVDGEHLARGFDKTLNARAHVVDVKHHNEFVQFFRRISLIEKGTVIDLVRDADGVVSITANAQLLATYSDDPGLGWALVDAFLGPKGHLDKKGKAELVRSAKDLFRLKPLSEFDEQDSP